jgi:hypothetical protein
MGRAMHWVRAKRRIGAWVALFALSLQLVLSFGHVHVHKVALSGPALAGISTSQVANGAPSDSDRRSGADDYCAICATISLASTLLVPELSRLTLPIAHTHAWLPEFQVALAAGEPHLLFQARAPPRASLIAG